MASTSHAQAFNHWQTVVFAEDEWHYFVGVTEPDSQWRDPDFIPSAWPTGPGGIGYGDGDDRTIIPHTTSLYMRREFDIADPQAIDLGVFNMDFDDGFVAWLNGTEIARSNVGRTGDLPAHDETARTNHEARMYQGGDPNYYVLDNIREILRSGKNVLAVQVHNRESNSSDMSAIPFLSVAPAEPASDDRTPPDWFTPPVIFRSSNLPILIIDTQGQTILNDERITAHLAVKHSVGVERNHTTDASALECRISIEIRGSSSAFFDKKSYNMETQQESGTNLNTPLLGLPKENDWILYGPYSDKSLLRNAVTFYLARAMGRYASRTRFCELVINGEYQGLYLLMEKIKRDKNRVNIATLTATEFGFDKVEGGFIIKVDKKEGEFDGWASYSNPPRSSWSPIFFQYVYPKHDTITVSQKESIQNYILEFERALNKSAFRDEASGYRRFIDLTSFVDHVIISELTKNIDSYRYSTFIHRDKDGPLVMGPIWDYNLAFGNVDYGSERAMETDGWMYNQPGRMYWFPRMMMDRVFKEHLRDRWFALRKGAYSDANIHALIDSLANHIHEAQARNFVRWPVLGIYLWPNSFVGETWEEELDFLERWLLDRCAWMDANMPYADTIVEQESEMSDHAAVHPNPGNGAFLIYYPRGTEQVSIYNLAGQRLRHFSLVSPHAGQILWDGCDQAGNALASGIYFIQIGDRNNQMVKVTLLR